MIISPIAPALWIAAQFVAIIQLVSYVVMGEVYIEPFLSLLMYVFYLEMSKFVAEITLKEEDKE